MISFFSFKQLQNFVIVFFLVINNMTGHTQKYNHNWAFGDNKLIQFTEGGPVLLSSGLFSYEGCATLSDENGYLLFYTNGNTVWDRNGSPMFHGRGLMGNTITSSTQGAVIAPSGFDKNKYYVFSLDENENEGIHNLYYSIVDMNLNHGLGDLEVSSKNTILDNDISEKMTLAAGSGCFIWLLVHHKDKAEFHAFKIDGSGIHTTPVISESGFGEGQNCYMQGEMKVSNDSKMITTCANKPRILELHQFDNSSGIVSNCISLNDISGNLIYGLSFSPNNQVLYAGNILENGLYQYDLSSYPDRDAVAASVFKINDNTTTGMRSSADGKSIYLVNNGIISRINAPDQLGLACDFQEDLGMLIGPNCSGLGNPFIPLNVPDNLTQSILFCPDTHVILEAQTGQQYMWNTGSTSKNITVDSPGIYWVEIKNGNCTATDSFVLTLSGCEKCLLIPNAFSPNGDGLNDQFVISSPCQISSFMIKIVNRWGQLVFQSYNINYSWNGTFNGTFCDQGSYFYEIHLYTADHQYIKERGDITLIR